MLVPEFEALGKTSGEFFAVRDDDQNRLRVSMSFEQQIGDHLRGFLIEISGWLIAQQKLRLHDQRARQSDTLLLAAGELRRAVVQTFGETDLFQQFS